MKANIFLVVLVSVILSICSVSAVGFAEEQKNLLLNGDFSTNLTDWKETMPNSEVKVAIRSFESLGLAAYHSRSNAEYKGSRNGIYQIVPVIRGKEYEIHGLWKGNLECPGERNYAELWVGFGSDPNIPVLFGTSIYKKRFDDTYRNANLNLDTQSGQWEWELLDESPDPKWSGKIIATDDYMTIQTNFGGRDEQKGQQAAWCVFDDLQLILCE